MGGIIGLAWVSILSLYAFVAMGWDKNKANKKGWRVSEKHFFITAALGGSLGVLAAMQYWRHKTQKWAFKGPVYGIVATQLFLIFGGLYLYLYYY